MGFSRVWALPVVSALAYSERYAREQGKRHKKPTEWAWQLLLQRAAPALLALFSAVTLFAHQQITKSAQTGSTKSAQTGRRTAWYRKSYPTFSDALALVCKELWAKEEAFCGSLREADTLKVPRQFVERLTDVLCYAA